MRVRHAEGRRHIRSQPDLSWDAIVIDAFLGACIPGALVTVEAFLDSARVAPLTLVNVVDGRTAREVAAVASSIALAYPSVWALGQRVGNTIVAGYAAGLGPDLAAIAARLAADRSPARLVPADRVQRMIAATPPLRDVGLSAAAGRRSEAVRS